MINIKGFPYGRTGILLTLIAAWLMKVQHSLKYETQSYPLK